MSNIISAITTANPVNRFLQKDVLKFMVQSHELNSREASRLEKLYEVSGIESRYSVLSDFNGLTNQLGFFSGSKVSSFPTTAERGIIYEKYAWQICKEAINKIFENSSLKPQEITHLITVSCTGMYAPGLDIDIIENLGLNHYTERTCINFMGCYGAFNALKAANYICTAQPDAKVLIADIELCTLHFQKENTLNNWVSNSLFSDGAAAVLIESELNRSTDKGFSLETFYTILALEGKKEMGWRIGNTGFEMHLSSQVSKSIKEKIHSVTSSLNKKANSSLKDTIHFAIHPGGRRILEVCEEALDLPEEALHCSYNVLKKFGNMSSATVLFVLKEVLEKAKVGEKVMSFAFGPGLTFESMILKTI